ncbi:MAG: carboxypeptidase-like regulatory domain-containing protein [Candidatus Acidiferrales bacterium]
MCFLLFAALATPATRLEIPTVRGIVVDSRGQALPSAVVYLYDHRTKMVRTHYADHNGRYRFSGLNSTTTTTFTPKTAGSQKAEQFRYPAEGRRDS